LAAPFPEGIQRAPDLLPWIKWSDQVTTLARGGDQWRASWVAQATTQWPELWQALQRQ